MFKTQSENLSPILESTSTSFMMKVPLKIILVGDQSSGKQKFAHIFATSYQQSQGVQQQNLQNDQLLSTFTFFEKPYNDYFSSLELIELIGYDLSLVTQEQMQGINGFILFFNTSSRYSRKNGTQTDFSPFEQLQSFLSQLEAFCLDQIVINVVILAVGEYENKDKLAELCLVKNIKIHKEAGILAYNVPFIIHHFFDRILKSDFTDITCQTPIRLSAINSPYVKRLRTRQTSSKALDQQLALKRENCSNLDYDEYFTQPPLSQRNSTNSNMEIQRRTFNIKSSKYFPSNNEHTTRIRNGQYVVITECSDENEVKVGDLNYKVLRKPQQKYRTQSSTETSLLRQSRKQTSQKSEEPKLREMHRRFANQNVTYTNESNATEKKTQRDECFCTIY